MKHISLSICALSGAIIAVGGILAESLEGSRRRNDLDAIGVTIAIASCLFTLFSVLKGNRVDKS